MVAPTASAEELVVDAENIVSLCGLLPKFVATKRMMQIAATTSAITGGENMMLRFMTHIMPRPRPAQKHVARNASSQLGETRLLAAMKSDG